jgi:exodeoxyribonuclease-3
MDCATGCVIHKATRGNDQPSDHAPVVVNLVWPPEDGEEEEEDGDR